MPVIPALYPARRRAGQIELEIDGMPLGPLPEQEVARHSLSVGHQLDEATLAALRRASGLAQALALANGYLAHRPRSEAEVRQRLRRAHLDDEIIAAAIQALVAQGLLDDRRFATLWVESRASFSPRSSRALEVELRQKGVDRDSIDEVLAGAGTDDAAMAIEAGRKRLRAFGALDEDTFRQRMSGYLGRRGFAYDVVRQAVETLWEEAKETS